MESKKVVKNLVLVCVSAAAFIFAAVNLHVSGNMLGAPEESDDQKE